MSNGPKNETCSETAFSCGDPVLVRAVVVHTLPNQPDGAAVRVRIPRAHRLVSEPEVVVPVTEVEHEAGRESVWKALADRQARAIIDLGKRLYEQRRPTTTAVAQYKKGDRVLYQGVEYEVEEVTFYGPNENVLAKSPTHGTVSAFAPSFTPWPKGDPRRPTATATATAPDPAVVLSAACDVLDNMSASPVEGYLVPEHIIERLRRALGGA